MSLMYTADVMETTTSDSEYDMGMVRQKAEQIRERLTEVATLKAEVFRQTTRAEAAEKALEAKAQRIAELEARCTATADLEGKVGDLQTALEVQRSLCQQYKRELDRERAKVADHEAHLKPARRAMSESGATSEFSLLGSETIWDPELPNADSMPNNMADLRAQLQSLREELASRNSQYARAVARCTSQEQGSRQLSEKVEEKDKRIAMLESLVAQQREELQKQREETIIHQGSMLSMGSEFRPRRNGAKRMNCFDMLFNRERSTSPPLDSWEFSEPPSPTRGSPLSSRRSSRVNVPVPPVPLSHPAGCRCDMCYHALVEQCQRTAPSPRFF